jgi:hypothetical protein
MNKLTILLASDQDSYYTYTLWINGQIIRKSDDSIMTEDILRYIKDAVDCYMPISGMELDIFTLYEPNTRDIPDYVNTAQALQEWYLETTGEELARGW